MRVRKDWGEFRAQKNGHFSRSFERDNMVIGKVLDMVGRGRSVVGRWSVVGL